MLKPHVPFKSPEVKDVDLVVETLIDCLKHGNDQALRDVLTVYLIKACNLEN